MMISAVRLDLASIIIEIVFGNVSQMGAEGERKVRGLGQTLPDVIPSTELAEEKFILL